MTLTADQHPLASGELKDLAARLRASDVAELQLSSPGRAPAEILEDAWERSPRPTAFRWHDRLCGVGGIVPDAHNAGCGIVWLLGSDELIRSARAFWQITRRSLLSEARGYRAVWNLVDPANTTTIRWLRRLGFTSHPPERHSDTHGGPMMLMVMDLAHVRTDHDRRHRHGRRRGLLGHERARGPRGPAAAARADLGREPAQPHPAP